MARPFLDWRSRFQERPFGALIDLFDGRSYEAGGLRIFFGRQSPEAKGGLRRALNRISSHAIITFSSGISSSSSFAAAMGRPSLRTG